MNGELGLFVVRGLVGATVWSAERTPGHQSRVGEFQNGMFSGFFQDLSQTCPSTEAWRGMVV